MSIVFRELAEDESLELTDKVILKKGNDFIRGQTIGDILAMIPKPGFAHVQTREQAVYTAPTSGNGAVVTQLNLVITPQKAGNKIILEWHVNGDGHQDIGYVVTRNNVLLSDSTDASNNRWAAVVVQPYDNNLNSTPENTVIRIIDENCLDVETTYRLCVRSTKDTTTQLKLNRSFNSTGEDVYETTLSTGTAQEIIV